MALNFAEGTEYLRHSNRITMKTVADELRRKMMIVLLPKLGIYYYKSPKHLGQRLVSETPSGKK